MFTGDNDKYECTIQLNYITTGDFGNWTCEMESYVFGPFRGTIKTKMMYLDMGSRATSPKHKNTTEAPISEPITLDNLRRE